MAQNPQDPYDDFIATAYEAVLRPELWGQGVGRARSERVACS
jgi:hypothetical protein